MPKADTSIPEPTSNQTADLIAELALTKKANDIIKIDVRKLTTITDYFLICSASTDQQVKAITDAIIDGISPKRKPWHVEGKEKLQWVLLDFIDVVVHVFHQKMRDFYQLERLWADAPSEIITDSITTPD